MRAKPWQTALAVALLLLFVGLLGVRLFGPQGTPTFSRSPAGPTPVEE